jgi:hypothetical protein
MPAIESQSTRVKPRNSQRCARSATRQGLVTPAMRRARSLSRGSRGARSTCRVRRTACVPYIYAQEQDDDYWSKFGLPVTGRLGVTRSDLLRRPDARFRIAVNESTYLHLVGKVRSLRRTWIQYELVVHNCNSFVSEIASSVDLQRSTLSATSLSFVHSMLR